jgi:hypothetical protein
MRKSLLELMSKAVVFRYYLPVDTAGKQIPRVNISNSSDKCLHQKGTNDDIAALIYNGIVEYAYNDNDIDLMQLDALQIRALQSKLKYNPHAPHANQLAHGFHGEVLLHLILERYYHANKTIARGYLFSALENAETKGYDSYLMIERDNNIYMLFGEAKFYISGYKDSLASIFNNIDKALSDEYLNRNFIAMDNHYEHIHPNSKIRTIIDRWRENPTINMAKEAAQNNMRLVYPMLVVFDNKANTYDDLIYEVIRYINDNYNVINPTLTIPFILFFIFLPVDNSRIIKDQVLQWISKQQPLMQ